MEHAPNHQEGVNAPPLDQRKYREEAQQYIYQTNRAVSVEADSPVTRLVATRNGNREHIQPIRYEGYFVVHYFIVIVNIISCP